MDEQQLSDAINKAIADYVLTKQRTDGEMVSVIGLLTHKAIVIAGGVGKSNKPELRFPRN